MLKCNVSSLLYQYYYTKYYEKGWIYNMSELNDNVFEEDVIEENIIEDTIDVKNSNDSHIESKKDDFMISILEVCGPKEFIKNTMNWHKGKHLRLLNLTSAQSIVKSIVVIGLIVCFIKSLKKSNK